MLFEISNEKWNGLTNLEQTNKNSPPNRTNEAIIALKILRCHSPLLGQTVSGIRCTLVYISNARIPKYHTIQFNIILL